MQARDQAEHEHERAQRELRQKLEAAESERDEARAGLRAAQAAQAVMGRASITTVRPSPEHPLAASYHDHAYFLVLRCV